MALRKIPNCRIFHHPEHPGEVIMPPGKDRHIESAMKYKAQKYDLFLCSYYKCGATWLQNIVWRILHDGKRAEGILQHNIAMLEFDGKESVAKTRNQDSKYHIIKTHFPYKWVPKHPGAKCIFITRAPKDVCVSYYYHIKGFPHYKCEDLAFDTWAEWFTKGKSEGSDYFEMLNEWYSHRNDPEVLFLLYEELLTNTKSQILKIAQFIDPEYSELLQNNNEELLNKIISETSINKMREQDDMWLSFKRTLPFIRKGIIGDWKNHMTTAQASAIDERLKKSSAGSGCEKLWEKWSNAYAK